MLGRVGHDAPPPTAPGPSAPAAPPGARRTRRRAPPGGPGSSTSERAHGLGPGRDALAEGGHPVRSRRAPRAAPSTTSRRRSFWPCVFAIPVSRPCCAISRRSNEASTPSLAACRRICSAALVSLLLAHPRVLEHRRPQGVERIAFGLQPRRAVGAAGAHRGRAPARRPRPARSGSRRLAHAVDRLGGVLAGLPRPDPAPAAAPAAGPAPPPVVLEVHALLLERHAQHAGGPCVRRRSPGPRARRPPVVRGIRCPRARPPAPRPRRPAPGRPIRTRRPRRRRPPPANSSASRVRRAAARSSTRPLLAGRASRFRHALDPGALRHLRRSQGPAALARSGSPIACTRDASWPATSSIVSRASGHPAESCTSRSSRR